MARRNAAWYERKKLRRWARNDRRWAKAQASKETKASSVRTVSGGLPLQAGHKKVRCSKLGNVVGSAWTASIRTISALQEQAPHCAQPLVHQRFMVPEGAYCDQASRDEVHNG